MCGEIPREEGESVWRYLIRKRRLIRSVDEDLGISQLCGGHGGLFSAVATFYNGSIDFVIVKVSMWKWFELHTRCIRIMLCHRGCGN